MYQILEEIKKTLDKSCIAVGNDDLVWRVKFACDLLNEKTNKLANIQLGLDEDFMARPKAHAQQSPGADCLAGVYGE